MVRESNVSIKYYNWDSETLYLCIKRESITQELPLNRQDFEDLRSLIKGSAWEAFTYEQPEREAQDEL